eukprot:scaffold935_cov334-Prasinococcus_capsulatus_cf.AAC.8
MVCRHRLGRRKSGRFADAPVTCNSFRGKDLMPGRPSARVPEHDGEHNTRAGTRVAAGERSSSLPLVVLLSRVPRASATALTGGRLGPWQRAAACRVSMAPQLGVAVASPQRRGLGSEGGSLRPFPGERKSRGAEVPRGGASNLYKMERSFHSRSILLKAHSPLGTTMLWIGNPNKE